MTLIRIRIATIVAIDQESVRHDGHSTNPANGPPCGPPLGQGHPPASLHQWRRQWHPQGRGPAPPSPRRTRARRETRHPLDHHRLHGGDPRAGGGGPAAPLLERACRGQPAGALLGHRLSGRDDRLPPPAQPPRLPAAPLGRALLRHLRRPQLPARPDRLGGSAPPPPQVLRHRRGPPHQPQGLLVEPHGLDVHHDSGHGRRAPAHRRPGQGSLLPLAQPQFPAAAAAPGRPAVLDRHGHRRRRLGPGALGHPPAPGAGVPLHLAGELRHPPLG